MLPQAIIDLSRQVIEKYTDAGLMIATAESCTGGLIAGALTAVSGSSAVLDRGFVTYSNEAKSEMLNVPMDLILERGAVSEPVVRSMVEGCLSQSRAAVAIAVTGIAGPGGGSKEKPVGLVYIAVERIAVEGQEQETSVSREFFGDISREEIRLETVKKALSMTLDQLRP